MVAPIYLDYMASTPVDPRVAKAMHACLVDSSLSNSSSLQHAFGWKANACIEKAQQQVASLIGAQPTEIIWTSGATESINLAIKGIADFYARQGRHIITLSTEHEATLATCRYLSDHGYEVTCLSPDQEGLLDPVVLKEAIRPDTILLSVMLVNNETGVMQPIKALAGIAKEQGVLVHVDAAQAIGKVPVNVKSLNIDCLSLSAHKMYGPKGVGALWVRNQPRVRLTPQIHGGSHQKGMRSGTLSTHQIVGLGEACHIAEQELQRDLEHVSALRDVLWGQLSTLPGVSLNGSQRHHYPGCMNILFDNLDSEVLMTSLHDVALSAGSACNSVSIEPSHVLLAMGLTRLQASQCLRLSLGRMTTRDEIDRVAGLFLSVVPRLRKITL